jgi:hypothetical protein
LAKKFTGEEKKEESVKEKGKKTKDEVEFEVNINENKGRKGRRRA